MEVIVQFGNHVSEAFGRRHAGLAAPLVVGLLGGLVKVHDAGDAGEGEFY